MVNLHHENIVRFITCWIEESKDIDNELLEESHKNEII